MDIRQIVASPYFGMNEKEHMQVAYLDKMGRVFLIEVDIVEGDQN